MLLEFTIANCIFCFNKKSINNYRVKPWVHLFPLSLQISIWNNFDTLAIPSSPTLMKWWFRYVDDVYSATRKYQVNKLQEHLNSIDPHIEFTIELPGTNGLSFLDTLTKPSANSNESSLQKTHPHR